MSKILQPQKDYRFKVLYAIGMIHIVAGHCINGGISLFYDWFPPYAFHLGLFAFSSGYFYKNTSEDNLAQYILRKAKTLLVPLYIWNVIYAVLVSALDLFGFTIGSDVTLYNLTIAPIVNGHQFIYNMGGWYVIPLYMVEVINALFRKLSENIFGQRKETAVFIIYLLLGVCGICLANDGYRTGWWLVLTRALYFLPVYGFGIFYQRVLEKYDVLSNAPYFLIIFSAQLVIIFICGRAPAYTPSWCSDFVDGPIIPFVVCCLGIAFWFRVAKTLEPIVGRSKVVNLIADNTFSIMINHFIGFMLLKAVFAFFHKYTGLFSNFDMTRFKTDVWYFYTPGGIANTRIMYVLAGITFPIIVQILINLIKRRMRRSLTLIKTQKEITPSRTKNET